MVFWKQKGSPKPKENLLMIGWAFAVCGEVLQILGLQQFVIPFSTGGPPSAHNFDLACEQRTIFSESVSGFIHLQNIYARCFVFVVHQKSTQGPSGASSVNRLGDKRADNDPPSYPPEKRAQRAQIDCIVAARRCILFSKQRCRGFSVRGGFLSQTVCKF